MNGVGYVGLGLCGRAGVILEGLRFWFAVRGFKVGESFFSRSYCLFICVFSSGCSRIVRILGICTFMCLFINNIIF